MKNKTVSRRKKTTIDAVEIIHNRYIAGKPEMLAMLEEELINADIARKIYDLRTQAGLSQRDLAKLVGTTASVICRLEDADYYGHSIAMLRRIASALNRSIEINFVQTKKSSKRAHAR